MTNDEYSLLATRRLRGLTLFEVLLVMTLLVLLGSLSLPALEGAFSHARLKHAGDQLRAAWAEARLAALETGQTQAFRCLWGTGRFHVGPLSSAVETGIGPESLALDGGPAEVDSLDGLEKNRLAEGVFFLRREAVDAQGTSLAVQAATPVAQGQWSEPIRFMPDGTASDVTLVLENDRQWQLRVTLRGLTGTSRAAEASPVPRVSP